LGGVGVTGGLDGRTAVVTGGSRGIGLVTARVLAQAGARVLCLARAGRRLDEAVESLGAGGEALPADLANAGAVDQAVQTIRDRCGGPPDLLVQAAGVFPLAGVGQTPPAEFARALQVNLIGPYRLAQPLIADMLRRRSGHVVTIGSVADRIALPGNVAYAAGKFGARAVHEVLREELRGSGVRVSLVSPGPVDTAIWDEIDPDNRPGFTPRSRMLRPEAVAAAVLYVVTQPPEVDVEELRLGRS
jgi:NAD(P)-dependent dehydrogenase (short-subunit alcohol dehydrogenase family)